MNPAVLAWALERPTTDLWRKLVGAYASGVTKVSHEGRQVEYRSLAEIERVLTTAFAATNSALRRPAKTVAVVAG